MKKFIVLAFVLILCAGAFALSIDAQNQIPSGSTWSFTVNYSSLSSGKELRVSLDNEILFVLFERNGSVFIDSRQNSSKVLAITPTDGKVSASIVGANTGDRTLKAEIFSSADVIDSDSITITFFVPISQDEREVLNSRINTLESELSKEKTKSLNMELDLNNKQTEINYLNTANSNLVEKISSIISEIGQLKDKGASSEQIVQKLQTDLNQLVEERQNPIQGLALLGGNNGGAIALIFIALLAVIGFVVYRRGKNEKLYG
ncbi:Uncharacterised protein [uncultured archaeon]|nr:Uncharacterised protein [uncultured archaeon]